MDYCFSPGGTCGLVMRLEHNVPEHYGYGIQFGACSALKNAITHGAHLHQTTATKDGAQIERHLVRTHSKKE